MPQNYRQNPPRENWRSDQAEGYAQGGRYRGGAERDRYQSGDEQRFQPDQERNANWNGGGSNEGRGFRGNRSYAGGGYSEEQGYRSGSPNRWQSGQAGAAAWRDDEARTEGDRDYWERQAGRGQPSNANSPNAGHDDAYDDLYNQAEDNFHGRPPEQDRAYETRSFYGTGNYAGVDEFAPFARMRGGGFYAEGRRDEHSPVESRFSSSNSRNYGRPAYGPQPNYGRSAVPQRYENQGYGPRAGSNPTGAGSYGYGTDDYHTSSHRGRGPKGYERSDERLREIISERLTDDPWIDASEVTVEVVNKTVKLTGTVNNRQTKYEIEELIERSTNVREIDNQLRVQAPNRNESSSQGGSATRSGGAPQSSTQASGLSSAGITSGGSSSTPPTGSARKN